MGFEPTIRYDRIPDFESGAFDLSATSPERIVILAESAWSSLAVAMPGLFSTPDRALDLYQQTLRFVIFWVV